MAGMSERAGWGRASFGARSALAVVLALGAAVLAVDVSEWRYVRVDLSASGRNTLDPAVLDVIDKLPEPLVVDVFFLPLASPYDGVSREAQGRMLELLSVALQARRGQIEVREHRPGDFEESSERLRELGIEGENLIVFSCGERRAELSLFSEVAIVDWGNPSPDHVGYLTERGIPGVVNPRTYSFAPHRPARLSEFRGEEAFTAALLKVSSGRAPKVYFARGHGEPSLQGAFETDTELSRLRSALERDGFAVAEWDPSQKPAVPEDCEVLALIGARQPYSPRTSQAVQDFVGGGGRALLAPDKTELEQEISGGIVDLLRGFGILTRPGVVCQPVVSETGDRIERLSQCALLLIDEGGMQASHELTEPLRRRGRRLQFRLSLSFEGSRQTESGLVLPLVTSPRDSWRDLPDPNGRYDFLCDPRKGETRERAALVCVAELRASTPSDGGAVRRGRVLGVASALFFENVDFAMNRDFWLNAFNWLTERDYRIAVSPLDRGESRLDLERGRARPILFYTLALGLPGLCAFLCAFLWLRRRTG